MGVPRAARGQALVVGVALTLILAACAESASPSGSATATAGPQASGAPQATPAPSTGPYAGAWVDVTSDALGKTAEWSNKLELADINGDGLVDLLFANGGDYEKPGTPVASRVFVNDGDGTFSEVTDKVMGDLVGLTRVIKVRDLNADGRADILLGNTFQTQSHLLLGAADGTFTDVTVTNLPAVERSFADLEIGDVDGDGDLDVVLVDWGAGNPFDVSGQVNLWLNDGTATFSDATADRMPPTLVGFSWEIELVDVDNDWDLDLAVSCKVCKGSLLYENDGSGVFSDVTQGRMPAFSNNYEFTPIDLDGDGFLDLVTINDGREGAAGHPEHVFRNEAGSFVDVTDAWWPADSNRGYDDNIVVALDVDSDGDADFVVGSLDGPDRLLINDGAGGLSVVFGIIDALATYGTLGWGVADLNGDGRPDFVESQGEVESYEDERVYFATDAVPPDTAPPIIRTDLGADPAGALVVHARVHDNRTPNMPHDWRSVEIRWEGGSPIPMIWYGENLFRASLTLPAGASGVRVCAVDAAGNEACSP